MSGQRSPTAKVRDQAHRDAACEILHALGKEDLLYAHHGVVYARNGAYERLASYYRGTNVMCEVDAELRRAREKFPGNQNSAHEGYAVILEELDELWDEVKGNDLKRNERMRAEAIQVAAMAIRFIEDLTP